MAHSHYVMDLYYDDGARDLRREVLRITAHDDDEATSEAIRIFGWRRPVRYEVRAIAKGGAPATGWCVRSRRHHLRLTEAYDRTP